MAQLVDLARRVAKVDSIANLPAQPCRFKL